MINGNYDDENRHQPTYWSNIIDVVIKIFTSTKMLLPVPRHVKLNE